MTVINVEKDYEALALVVTAQFRAPVSSIWELWADPRKLERWWGPPTYPATVEEHDLTPGGEVTYYMTSPEGDRYRGWWRVVSVDPPKALEFMEGFADGEGNRLEDPPGSVMAVTITEEADHTLMEVRASFESREGMEKLVSMGMAEGLAAAMGQMDELLA